MDDLKTGLKYLDTYNHLIPAPAHLSACVESVQAVQPNNHYDVTKDMLDMLLLLFGEVILDVEVIPDLIHGPLLDDVGNGLAGGEQEVRHVHEVGGVDELEQSRLVHVEELLVKVADVVRPVLGLVISGGRGVVLVLLSPLEKSLKIGGVYLGQRNGIPVLVTILNPQIRHEVSQGEALLGDIDIDREHFLVT